MGGTKLSATQRGGYSDALGKEPEFDAQPQSLEEISEATRWADDAGKAVIPWGGGGGQSYGYAPTRADILLDLTRLNRILAVEPGDLTITVEAGATLASVQSVLASHGQFLPISVKDADRATIGGILATAADSAVRDWVIGMTVIDALGRIVKGGGKVVKNVTGYDIPKMHLGALGTLGILAEVTFKVAPIPEAQYSLYFGSPNATFLRLLHQQTQPSTSVLTQTSETNVLTVTYTGLREVVADEGEKAIKIARENGVVQVEAASSPTDFTADVALAARITGLPDSVPVRHESLWKMGLWETVETLPMAGATTVFFRNTGNFSEGMNALLRWAEANQATFAVLNAPFSLRQGDFPLWRPLPPSLPLMRRLKQALDPKATLNPGRFIDRI
ncbi:MAG: FAD-binding oxidoreductase [bacterium]